MSKTYRTTLLSGDLRTSTWPAKSNIIFSLFAYGSQITHLDLNFRGPNDDLSEYPFDPVILRLIPNVEFLSLSNASIFK